MISTQLTTAPMTTSNLLRARLVTAPTLFVGFVLVTLSLFVSSVPVVHAQAFYVEPTSPSGGSTAWPLNSSATTQYKRGSLLIGPKVAANCTGTDTSGCASLCLNATNETDATNCITSWSSIRSNYVRLQEIPPSSPPTTPETMGTPDVGFARLQGRATEYFSLVAEAALPPGGIPATAIYASDSGLTTNWAAKFNGGVFIGYDSASAQAAFKAQLCLNSNSQLSATSGGKGCIQSWSDLSVVASTGNYVLLQSTSVIPNSQAGQIAISGGASLARDAASTVVIGAPPSGTPMSLTCGDSICNASECSLPTCNSSNANYCPADCDRTPPGQISVVEAIVHFVGTNGNYRVSFDWSNPADADLEGIKVIRTTGNPAVTAQDTGLSGQYNFYVRKTAGVVPSTLYDDGIAAGPDHPATTVLSPGNRYYYTFFSYDSIGNYSAPLSQPIYRTGGTCSDCVPPIIGG